MMEVEGKLKYKRYKNLPKQSETKRRDKQKCACCIDEKRTQPNEGVTTRNDGGRVKERENDGHSADRIAKKRNNSIKNICTLQSVGRVCTLLDAKMH